MEGVSIQNLIDFDLPAEVSVLSMDAGQQQGHRETFGSGSSTEAHLRDTDVSQYQEDGGGDDSDATESADSVNDMESPSHTGALRRSSSSSTHSREDADAETLEGRTFMKDYVQKIFHGKEDFDQEEKALFGQLCSGDATKGRQWFAQYVSAQRSHSKCVCEASFYRLVQSFALVLFECYQVDDYSPAKNLMTMCFTYYYIGKCRPSPSELLEPGAPPAALDLYLNKANSWLSGKKDQAERLLKNTSRTDVKGFFGGLESKLRSNVTPKTEEGTELQSMSPVSEVPVEKKGEKIYLYTHLKQQPIWHSLRFWNAAFFDAVHCERKKRSPTTREKWCHMTVEEREDRSKIDENIAFGQLGTFTHNMLAFGLSEKLCKDFLKKQAVIGNLNPEQYKLLSEHIEKMAAD
ncbi:uncharacterized protein KIAA0513 homolog isoform X2 [Cynoglossus semilaevis]|uniref:uncharacterized protein KIAA0513 homolog isoform X2 n=1 Tax=Cynoglossus semilaevis TaxID=244447 RepID=UPI0004967F30|nr:uncharacterized protein KIAA0513 homolog isoform X2 [Cynoglossus semilaevis]